MTVAYEVDADVFDPDRFVREAVDDGDLIAAATIALESYGWQLYNFISRQVQLLEIDEVFARVADEIVRGLPDLVSMAPRVRDWIYTLVHGAWIRTQASDPRVPLEHQPAFARWVQQMIAGFRRAAGLERDMERARAARVLLRIARSAEEPSRNANLPRPRSKAVTANTLSARIPTARFARGSGPVAAAPEEADIVIGDSAAIARTIIDVDEMLAPALEIDGSVAGDTIPVYTGLARELNTIASRLGRAVSTIPPHAPASSRSRPKERIAMQRLR